MYFTRKEKIICFIYGTSDMSRLDLIKSIEKMREALTPQETILEKLATSTIEKLSQIGDKSYINMKEHLLDALL